MSDPTYTCTNCNKRWEHCKCKKENKKHGFKKSTKEI
jgi:hypothetical protein